MHRCTEHSMTFLLEIMHYTRNLYRLVSYLLAEKKSAGCAAFQN